MGPRSLLSYHLCSCYLAALAPFFQLPGRLLWSREVVQVELRPFNNRQLNRDLLVVCQRVNEFQPRLPDGRLLILHAPSLPFL
jgi:hypothetical protein